MCYMCCSTALPRSRRRIQTLGMAVGCYVQSMQWSILVSKDPRSTRRLPSTVRLPSSEGQVSKLHRFSFLLHMLVKPKLFRGDFLDAIPRTTAAPIHAIETKRNNSFAFCIINFFPSLLAPVVRGHFCFMPTRDEALEAGRARLTNRARR